MIDPLVAAVIMGGIICAFIALAVGDPTRENLNLCLGFFLGPIGILIAAVMPRDRPLPPAVGTKACSYCAERIQLAAIVCRFCGRDVAPVVTNRHGTI